jgi:hypothetical protein
VTFHDTARSPFRQSRALSATIRTFPFVVFVHASITLAEADVVIDVA